jgi:PTH1 family peptidyl-tRNA hydrolase
MLQLVALLGNPGAEYERTRHNAAWMLAEAMPFYPMLNWQKKFKGLYASLDSSRAFSELSSTSADMPEKLHFIKPQNYMNLSGESVKETASFYKIKLDEIIVAHDEIELPFGTLSLKFSGGMGGHNGLRSMKTCFGSADFWRLRIGIGRPDDRLPGAGGNPESSLRAGIADWVLSDFTSAEAEALVPVFIIGATLLTQALTMGPEPLLPQWAKKSALATKDPVKDTL